MRYSTIFLSALFAISAQAADFGGTSADGCSYKIINGKYLHSCEKKNDAVKSVSAKAEPVTSYGDVPLRYDMNAPRPSVQATTSSTAPATMSVKIETPSSPAVTVAKEESPYDVREQQEIKRLVDKTYVGVQLGGTTITESNAGATTGFGLNVGTSLDEHFAVELGYSYAKQDLDLDLDTRGSGSLDSMSQATSDSTLKAHLISAEALGHLTDIRRRFRPYLGLGLGWKMSSLDEKTQPGPYGNSPSSGGSLSQNSLGGLGSAGAKFRLSKAFQLGMAFRYFFPFARQSAKLDQTQPRYQFGYPTEAKLSQADSALTGSSQYQLVGGLQWLF